MQFERGKPPETPNAPYRAARIKDEKWRSAGPGFEPGRAGPRLIADRYLLHQGLKIIQSKGQSERIRLNVQLILHWSLSLHPRERQAFDIRCCLCFGRLDGPAPVVQRMHMCMRDFSCGQAHVVLFGEFPVHRARTLRSRESLNVSIYAVLSLVQY
jgi:hypothetical protein